LKRPILLQELRSFLKQRLPGYMVPQLILLEKFPLTPNGKLDKLALPSPNRLATQMEEPARQLEGPVEELLARLWGDLLQVPNVSAYDNFFDLGGHSLLATQMVTRLEDELGVQVKPRELAFQTLGQLAASCTAKLQSQ
jgi:acyl carrier protein